MRLHSSRAWKDLLRDGAGRLPRRAADGATAGDFAARSRREKERAARAIAEGIEFLLPTTPLEDILPGAAEAEVVMLPRLIRSHLWAMPEHELLVLGAMARMIQPETVVEFGTFRGGSTLAMAANMPAHGRVVTIDVDPAARSTHLHGLGEGLLEFDVGCLFRGTRFERMIEQRFVNSLHFDTRDLAGRADLVFVDADHTYEFTKRDTEKALTMVRPGGWILWHDYTWAPENSECAGVTRAVNEFLAEHGDCHHVANTRFAIHRVPGAAGTTKA